MREAPLYNQADIQRYLQKQMSAPEMHEFERALMDDPFLADAMEGYAAGNETLAEQHLRAIEKNLSSENTSAKVFALPSLKTSWIKVAAIVIVIVSAGIISYFLLNRNISYTHIDQQTVAGKAEAVSKQQDSISPAEKPIARLELSKDELLNKSRSSSPVIKEHGNTTAKRVNAEISRDRKDATSDKDDKADVLPGSGSAAVLADESVAAKAMQAPLIKKENEFKGKVVSKNGEPLAFANVSDDTKKLATVTDAEGKFSLKAADSVLKVDVTSAGYASANTEINSNKTFNNIEMEENNQSRSEVMVTSMNKKSRSSQIAVPNKANAGTNAEPKGGWQNFNQYLNRKADSVKAFTNNSSNKNVVLEFSIDKNGEPTNIKPKNRVDKTTAARAKEILSNGPKWSNNSNQKKIKVIIPVNN